MPSTASVRVAIGTAGFELAGAEVGEAPVLIEEPPDRGPAYCLEQMGDAGQDKASCPAISEVCLALGAYSFGSNFSDVPFMQ
jgi:hypothetical protein